MTKHREPGPPHAPPELVRHHTAILPEYHEAACLHFVMFLRFLMDRAIDPTQRQDYKRLYRHWRQRRLPPPAAPPSALTRVALAALARRHGGA